jgi:hypothetical protein
MVKKKKEAERRAIERQKEEEEKKILKADEKRQRDQLEKHNNPRALQELRDLIRERYELDMEIYRLRNVTPANRDLVIKRMVKSDEILQTIRSIVEIWNPESFETIEWSYAEQVKDRLLADGKRIWATDPPWPKDGVKGRLPPPPPRRGRPPPPRGGRPPSESRNQA